MFSHRHQNKCYEYVVHATNYINFFPDLPTAPTGLTTEFISRDNVSLRWNRPSDTGGVPLSGYIIEQRDGRTGRWRVAAYADANRTFWTAHNLIQGYEYNYRVRAENPDGAGPPSTLSTPVVPKPVVCKYHTMIIYYL